MPSFRPDAEERAQLEALGYLQGAREPIGADAALGRVGGPDPKREIGSDRRDRGADAAARRAARRGGARRVRSRSKRPAIALHAARRNRGPRSGRRRARRTRGARRARALRAGRAPGSSIAKAQIQRGRFAEAKQSLERALALDPEKSEPWLGLGFLAEREGRSEEAIQRYERARSRFRS